MTTKLHYEDLAPGLVLRHTARRTLTETDNVLSCVTIMSSEPLQLDAEFAREVSPTGERLFNSAFTLGLMLGVSTHDLHYAGLPDLGFNEIAFPHAARVGDTLRIETEVVAIDAGGPTGHAGQVTLTHRAYNQQGHLIGTATRDVVVQCRPGRATPEDARN